MAVTVFLDGPLKNDQQVEYFNQVMKVVSIYQKYGKVQKQLEKLVHEPKSKEYKALQKQLKELEQKVSDCVFYHFYGGAIRGGKTYIGLAILVILCKMFPRSKWHVIRASFPRLKETSIPSLEKILGNTPDIYWKRSQSEYFCQFPNGSRIYFVAESYDTDKQLNKFKGLETNGFLLEQMEEMQQEGFFMVLSRAGSHYGVTGPMPPPIVLGNFNPTFTWVKRMIYDQWKRGVMTWDNKKKDIPLFTFCKALPSDNPHVTDSQWRVWDSLDEDTKARMIRGEWDIEVKKAFLYAFKRERNIGVGLKIDYNKPIWISFDFNVDPMTACIGQTDSTTYLHITNAFRIENSDTYDLCRQIKPLIKGREHMVFVTGDASGKNRIAGAQGHINHYQIIASELGLKSDQFRIPGANPLITDSRVFMNSLVEKFPEFLIDSSLEDLINDIMFTTVSINRKGEVEINKTGINEYTGADNRTMGHQLDNVRYLAHQTLGQWLTIPKS